eukprot:scaffold3035_cov111-Isochrysis_galbana.AAC.9
MAHVTVPLVPLWDDHFLPHTTVYANAAQAGLVGARADQSDVSYLTSNGALSLLACQRAIC